MTTAETPRQIAWSRRRASIARTWQEFAGQRAALIGLILLGATVVVALLLPLISDQSGLDVTKATGEPLSPPNGEFWLGTDNFGRSVLLMTIWGSRISLLVGFSAALLSVVIGTLIGITAAHFGGWVSATLLRFTDFFLVLPSLILAIALSAVLPRGIGTIIVAIGLTAWPSTARLVRAQTLTIESRPYIERSRALGGGHLHVIGKHVLPGVMPLVLANTTLVVGNAVIADATLSFLGVGDPNSVTWGLVLESALNNGAISRGAWWNVLPPGIAIVLVVLFFTLVGRGLETVFNPRLKK
jgi:peptide/nickel transport system permease protein